MGDRNVLYSFLEKQGLDESIMVSPCPEGGKHPTIALYGDFNYKK